MDESDIEKIANIVARQLGLVLKKGNFWGIQKEGEGYVLVYDPTQLVDFSGEALLGTTLHEACHIKFSSHEVQPSDFPKAMRNYPNQLSVLLNILENWRIENLAKEFYPMIFRFFKRAYEESLPHRIPLDRIKALTFCEFLDRLRFDYKLTALDFKGEPRLDLLRDIELILPIVREYSYVKTRGDRLALTKTAWVIYKRYLEDEDKPKEKKKKKIPVPNIEPIPYPNLRQVIKNDIRNLVEELKRLKLSENTKLSPNKTSGKLNLKKLYRAGMNNPKLFSKKQIEKVEYPEFSVWLDTSGSMAWDNKIYAGLAGLIMIGEACEELGITCTLGRFAKSPSIVKAHNEKLKSLQVESIYKAFGGGTQEYKALRMAYNSFSGTKEKKVIVLITDGLTESITNLKSTLAHLQDKVKIIALGINLLFEDLSLFPNRVLTTPKSLAKNLSNILKKELQ